MIKLHLSKEEDVVAFMAQLCGFALESLCDKFDSNHILPRGHFPGQIPPSAINSEFHCPDCVRKIKGN